MLNRAKTLVEPALRAAVGSLDENLQLPVTYHLGWTDKDGNPSDASSGKGVRSALAVLGAEAVGALAATAVAGGVAVELIHNFSLIHDDIMDNDRTRRHRATVWDVFGIGDGILVGDAMHALAFQALLEDTTTVHSAAATRRLAQATSAMIAGQAQDVALDRGNTATLEDCIDKVQTPVLVVHGKRDAIFSWQQATRIVDALPGRATLMMDEDGVHCCHNHSFQYRTAMADWLAAML